MAILDVIVRTPLRVVNLLRHLEKTYGFTGSLLSLVLFILVNVYKFNDFYDFPQQLCDEINIVDFVIAIVLSLKVILFVWPKTVHIYPGHDIEKMILENTFIQSNSINNEKWHV